ncbi:MAG: Transposase IS200 like protein [Firmicutes bacterium ADurb.Bin193]|nr:MAG: Transposase IS200 like protein [Firmicutes bacterium ADurb.Bin193]
MPRQARKKSESGIYHVMLRGINRQTIFEDEEDCNVFLETIAIYKDDMSTCIYGYCLMKNHIHLLVKSDKLSDFMRKIGAKYVYWYNWKYDRIGGLFQDRYKSEVVEDDGYFLTVLRYIHQNPIRASITETIDEYEFSSYNEYIKSNGKKIIDTDFVFNMLSLNEFIKFHNETNNDKCLEIIEVRRINDEIAKSMIYKVSKCKNPSEFQALDLYKRDKYIKILKENGLSIRQIERLTGINRGIVLKA